MAEAKKNERTNALKEVKRLCKEFSFTAGMLKGALAEGGKSSRKRIIAMKLAVRASKIDAVKLHLLSTLQLEDVNIVAAPSIYGGITILNLDESTVSTLRSIRHIEALLLDEVDAAELQSPPAASDALSFKSLDGIDEREQYEHLSQLLYIQKATRGKR